MSAEIQEQWKELDEEYKKLDQEHKAYLIKLKDITIKQNACLSQIAHQRYRLKALNRSLGQTISNEKLDGIKEECIKREAQLQLIEETLPRRGGFYLRVILGNINVGFLSQETKFNYKEEYEKFKLVCIIIAAILVMLNMLFPLRLFQKVYLFFLVWYYSTLTIRESILRANGSKIKLWWRIHHGLSVFASIVLLVWPENSAWDEFKGQFFRYNLFTCFVQYLQFKYQRGTLYKLKALGRKDNMELTIEGFQHWMWRGLAFLYPFLFATYFYQLINAYVLYRLYIEHPESSWHILMMSALMLTFFIGNSVTALLVIPGKIRNRMVVRYKLMTRTLYEAVSVSKIPLNISGKKSG